MANVFNKTQTSVYYEDTSKMKRIHVYFLILVVFFLL